jgi:UDP-glucose 4-epimerase
MGAVAQVLVAPSPPMRILVTGGSGLVGTALVPLFTAVGHDVVVLDVRAPSARARFARCDLADEDPTAIIARERPDVVVHLAARVDPPNARERAVMRRLHVDGTRALVRAARAAGTGAFVLASSATVYGAWPDNPVPLTEEHALRPHPGLAYAVDKADAERVVVDDAGAMRVAIARPAIIYGRRAKSYLTELLRRAPGVFAALDGLRPPMQFVHVDDAARAFAALALRDVAGAFNMGADAIPFDEVARIARVRVVDVPKRFVAPIVDRLAPFMPPTLRAPSPVLDHLMHPFVVDAGKLTRTVGWTPARTSAEALAEMLSR